MLLNTNMTKSYNLKDSIKKKSLIITYINKWYASETQKSYKQSKNENAYVQQNNMGGYVFSPCLSYAFLKLKICYTAHLWYGSFKLNI